MTQHKRLGIIGGMGSVAAAYFFDRLVQLTPAETDQQYVDTVLHNNTRIPDRTDGTIGNSLSPLPELEKSVTILNRAGVDYLVLACITSHYFVEDLQKNSEAIILSAITETADHCHKLGLKKVGVIASTGATKLGLFQKQLQNHGIEALIMNDAYQLAYFTEPIYESWGIKTGHTTGRPRDLINRGAQTLIEAGAEAIIAGCSELPLVMDDHELPVPLIDSIDILLGTAIMRCLGVAAKMGT
jgi:aspartate racemase